MNFQKYILLFLLQLSPYKINGIYKLIARWKQIS